MIYLLSYLASIEKFLPQRTFPVLWGNPQSPSRKGGKYMSELLFFLLGLVIGGLTGITLMCMLQISRIADERLINSSEIKHEKKNS